MKQRPTVCDRIEPDLVASAIGEASSEATRRVDAHVAACQPCRSEFQQYRHLDDTVLGLRQTLPPETQVAAAREKLEARLLDLRSRLVAYRIVQSPVGAILIARSEQGVLLVEYLDRAPTLAVSRIGRMRNLELVEDGREGESFSRDLQSYLEGRMTRLPWPLDLGLVRSDFQRAVLRETAAIPYGAVVSYKGLARDLGRPEAVRAVAQALRWNPVPIAIPCHRVIGHSGALTGYAGGETGKKQKLLALEGVPVVRARRDFEVARNAMYVLMPGDTEYCLPTCPEPAALETRAPTFFASRERAESAGLLPCTTCRPDLHPLVPIPR